jgi:hypothetical protein
MWLRQMTAAVTGGFLIIIALASACQPRQAGFIEPANAPANAAPPDTTVVIRSREVRIDVSRLAEATTLSIPTFGAETLQIIRERTARVADGLYWYGRIEGQPGSSVTLMVKGEALIGNIRTQQGQAYEIRYLGGGVHRLQEVDPSRYPPEAEPLVPEVRAPAEADVCTTDPPTDIDVLVIYTDDARVAAGGTDAIEATAFLAVEETNQSYLNSNVTQRLRLAHVSEVNYAETGTSSTDLMALRNKTDGIMDNVHTLRDTHAADIVVLLTESLDACGRAHLMTPVQNAFESSAFGVVRRSCATGNYSFGHELGHNMSARHDWAVDNINNSPYAFNHGHLVTAPGDTSVAPWRTVMSYNEACITAGTSCTRILYWSNPFINYPISGTITDPMGISTGTQQTDNHQTLANTALTVANFRCSSPTTANVWMKDTWNDTGQEPDPNTAGDAMWRSPYIWVRNTQDANLTHQHQHQDPQFGSTNWIYIKLHNGASTAMSGNLELYYADASTSLTWPAAWTLIGTVPVNNLAGHGTQVVEQQWSSIPGTGHFCLLARWVTPSDPMATAEGSDINANVRNNNNLVWRNVNIIDLTSPDAVDEASLIVRNPDQRSPITLSLGVGWRGDDRQPSFLQVGDVSIRLDDLLREAWEQGGSSGTGFEQDNYGLRVGNEGADISGLVLQPGAQGRLYIRMQRLPSTPRGTYWLEVVQIVGRRPAGGVTYEIHTDRVP